MLLSYTVIDNDKFENLHQIIKEKFYVSDRLLLKLKNSKMIFLNGIPTFVKHAVLPNDVITLKIDFQEDNSNVIPTKMKLDIIYEDEYYIVVNKAPNMPIHPSMDNYSNTLSNGIRYYYDLIGLKKKIRPVNRLDKDTSGIVIFAKNEYIQECLVKQMKNKTFIKQYIAICNGTFTEQIGTINERIDRKPGSIIERCISDSGDVAITHYLIIKNLNGNLSEVLCTLETGRTHQIRVHLSHIGHPIIGDTLYGTASKLINRQALHSYRTCFIHPITKINVEYIAPIHDDMNLIIK